MVHRTQINRHRPWHERLWFFGRIRTKLRTLFFRWLGKTAITDDAKALLAGTLGDLLSWRPPGLPHDSTAADPYPDLGRASAARPTSLRGDVIFITARFRSGSTLLWNLFRHLPGCTAYYEPFNERRWFDPATRGRRIDPTHRGAEEYWREYEGLTELDRYYRESWIDRDLYMDAAAWNPGMKRYVELLIEGARGRPVLQFNRIDFRLPWFRRNFPHAAILHLYRHPRDQWISSLGDPRAFPPGGTWADFALYDHFYLGTWARDLKYRFPFLAEDPALHPYRTFYYLWKLSYLFGRAYAHHSLAYEDLISDPDRQLDALFRKLEVAGSDIGMLRRLIVQPQSARRREYADAGWFQEQEGACERVLADFFSV